MPNQTENMQLEEIDFDSVELFADELDERLNAAPGVSSFSSSSSASSAGTSSASCACSASSVCSY